MSSRSSSLSSRAAGTPAPRSAEPASVPSTQGLRCRRGAAGPVLSPTMPGPRASRPRAPEPWGSRGHCGKGLSQAEAALPSVAYSKQNGGKRDTTIKNAESRLLGPAVHTTLPTSCLLTGPRRERGHGKATRAAGFPTSRHLEVTFPPASACSHFRRDTILHRLSRPEEGARSRGLRHVQKLGQGEDRRSLEPPGGHGWPPRIPWSPQEDTAGRTPPRSGPLTAGAVTVAALGPVQTPLAWREPPQPRPFRAPAQGMGRLPVRTTCPSCFLPLPRRGDRGPRRFSGPDLGVTLTPPMLPPPPKHAGSAFEFHLTPSQQPAARTVATALLKGTLRSPLACTARQDPRDLQLVPTPTPSLLCRGPLWPLLATSLPASGLCSDASF